MDPNNTLTLERVEEPGRVTFHLAGVASLRTSRELKEYLISDAARLEIRQIVLEMGRIEMLDSSVLGILLEAQQKLVRRAGQVLILTPSEEMSDLLAMTDLETLIPVVREVSLLPAVS
jgi:anti-anti-sigma factor